MKKVSKDNNFKLQTYQELSFNQQRLRENSKIVSDDIDYVKEGIMDQNYLLAITIVDFLQNLVDGTQLLLAYWNIDELKSMNQFISNDCNSSQNLVNEKGIENIVYQATPIIIATIFLNIVIAIHVLCTRRAIKQYFFQSQRENNKSQTMIEAKTIQKNLNKQKCLQIGIVQMRVLLRIELMLKAAKEFYAISDIIIILITIMWISEKQNQWNKKIIALDLNIVYLITRLQMQFNLFNILKSTILILIIIFQYINRGFLSNKAYSISTLNKWQGKSNFNNQQNVIQASAFNNTNLINQQQNNVDINRKDELVFNEESVADQDKKIDAISFYTQNELSKQQSNLSSKKNSPVLRTAQRYPHFGKKEENLIKISPTILQIMETIPTTLQGLRKQSIYRKIISSENFIDKQEIKCKVSNLSNQILNQINQGVVLMNFNQCIEFHNKQMLDILSVNKSQKIITKLFKLKKEIKVKEGDLLDNQTSAEMKKQNNQKIRPKTSHCILSPQNKNHEMSGKNKSLSNTNFSSSSTSIRDISGQAGARMKSKRNEQKKQTYLNNKSASTCDFLVLPPKGIFKSNQSKKKKIDQYEENDNQNEEKSIREVEEDQDSDDQTYCEKYENNIFKKKSIKNIKKLRQSFSAQKNEGRDNKKEYKEKSKYSTDEKSFEVIIQEIISLVQLYKSNMGYRPCKSENNLDHSAFAQEEWYYNCEKTINILQNEGYTFNAILENEDNQNQDIRANTIQSNNLISEEQLSTKKLIQNSQKILSGNLPDLKNNSPQKQNEQDQNQRSNKIISVQIKLWNSPSTNTEKDQIELKEGINGKEKKVDSTNLTKSQHKKSKKLSSIIAEKLQVPLLFIIFQDITKQVEQEEQDKMNRFKLKILSSISHELRTPLNCSMGMLQMLIQSDLISLTVKQDYLEPAYYNNQLLYFIINDILDYAQISQNSFQLKFSSFELYPALQDCLNLFSYSAEFKGIHLSLHVDSSIPSIINSDQERIKQVLINLVSNALKYTTVGSICVNAVPSKDQKDMIEISVEDTGCGIPAHLHNIIFEYMDNPNQRKQELNSTGAGLGLTISQKIVRGLSGNQGISLESEEGLGSKFTFSVKNREPYLQKSTHGKKNNQFNNIFLNWRSMSYTTFQSQEFKSDLSSMKGYTNKSQLTPIHGSSPQSRGSMNFGGSKDEIDKRSYLNAYALRNSYMRKGSKFLEENLISREQNTISSSIDHSYEIYHMNHISERRQSRKSNNQSNNQLSINYNEKTPSLKSQIQYLDQDIDGKKILLDLKGVQQIKSCDIIDSNTDFDKINVQALQPFQGHSSIAYQEQITNKKIITQASNVSSTSNSQNTFPQLSSQTDAASWKHQNNLTYQENISQLNKNLRILAAQQCIPSPNTSITGLLNTVKEINDESVDLDSTNNIFSSEKNGSSSRKLIVKTKFNGSASPLFIDDRNTPQNQAGPSNIIVSQNNSTLIQDTPRQLSAYHGADIENIKIGSSYQDQNNITFNSGFFIESERTPAINLSKVSQQESICSDQVINEILSPEKKSNMSYSFNQQTDLIAEIKTNKQSQKMPKNQEQNSNEQEGADMDKLIQQQTKEQLQQKQEQLKKNLQQYFERQKCKCNQVLVVDDNQFNVLVMKKLLQSYFINADQAFNGKNAFDMVVSKQDSSCCHHYKLILMDIEMPIMNGYESTQAILDHYKEKCKNISPPIISACTAFVSKEDQIQAKKRGMKFFLGKPIQLFHLDFVLEYGILKRKK